MRGRVAGAKYANIDYAEPFASASCRRLTSHALMRHTEPPQQRNLGREENHVCECRTVLRNFGIIGKKEKVMTMKRNIVAAVAAFG